MWICLCMFIDRLSISLFNGGSFGFGTIVGFILLIGLIYLLVRPSKESDTAEVEFAVK